MENIKKIKEMLMKAIFEVFERVFFVFAEPVGEAIAHYQIRANIRFKGPMEGALQISMSENLAKIMAKNMLGLDDDQIKVPVMADCVKECLNMVCGSFVRRIDPDQVFHLEIPSSEMISKPYGHKEAHPDASIRLVFDTEGGAFEVMMTAPGFLQT